VQHHEHPNDSLDDRRQDSPTEFDDEGTLVVERHFAIVPEWIIDAEISDAALPAPPFLRKSEELVV